MLTNSVRRATSDRRGVSHSGYLDLLQEIERGSWIRALRGRYRRFRPRRRLYGSNLYRWPKALRIYRIGGDQDNPLVDGPGSKAAPFVSADGTRVMFLDNVSGARQVWTVRADGTGLRQVTHELGGVLSAVMSDDGKVAWYVSGSGRICQVSLDSGIAVARAGTITEVFTIPDLVAGSTAIISGMGFSDTADYANSVPLPRKLGGVSVSIGGVDVPLISVSPTSIALQVPWEDSTGSGPTLSFDVHVDSPASEVSFPMYEWGPVEVSAVSPTFILNLASPSPRGGYDVVAAHENWDGLVTAQNPGKPNEIIHIYGTGFGKVNAAPATGYPATADPPASTMFPVFCWAGPGLTQALPIIFSGLAPGLVGYYQIDMQLPASGVYDQVEFYCIGAGVIGGGKFLGSFWMLPLQ